HHSRSLPVAIARKARSRWATSCRKAGVSCQSVLHHPLPKEPLSTPLARRPAVCPKLP
ncbi:KTSC domain-containing protein, partial [Dysosmobacter welbionis]